MPELPEVETIVRELSESEIIGKKVIKLEVFWDKTIATEIKEILFQSIKKVSRRGKYIVFTLSKDTLLIHLRMTGKIFLSDGNKNPSTHERVRLILEGGLTLHFEDQRKFGRWYLVKDVEKHLFKLGIEPLSKDFTLKKFQSLLQKSSSQIKSFLLNQKYIAGLGNIYVDEALWKAKIHPLRKINSLTTLEINALYKAIQHVLEIGISFGGTTLGPHLSNYRSMSGKKGNNQEQLKVFNREGLTCPRCGKVILKIKVAERGTHICPNCQKI